MLFIGIDLSDKFFDSCITNSDGDVLATNRFSFDDDGFSEFTCKVTSHESDNQNVSLALKILVVDWLTSSFKGALTSLLLILFVSPNIEKVGCHQKLSLIHWMLNSLLTI